MATIGGPNLEKDNLVFGYDTGYGVADNSISTRFYPGGPTVNYVTDSSILSNGFGGSSTILDSSTKSFQLNINSFNASGQTWRSFMWDMRSHAGSAVTISATVEVPGTSPGDFAWVMVGQAMSGTNGTQTANYLPYSTSSERYQKTTSNTERITWSGTVGNTGTANQPNGIIGFTVWYNGGTAGVNSFIKVSNVQIELKPQATPFVNGTRSTTQSLIDLKRTTDINVSNISFDSTGQPSFDGTDDILNTGLFSGRNPTTDPFTIEAIVKSDTTSGAHMWLDATSNGTNQRLYCAYASSGTGNPMGIQNSGWSSSGVNDTDFHHYVIVMDGSVARLYNNGEAHSTKNYTSYQIQALKVGGRSGYRWVGTIPVFKIHNQVLSANQVKQNYNAYKNRFDI